MKEELTLRLASETPELSRYSAAWDAAAKAYDYMGMLAAEKKLFELSRSYKIISVEEWADLNKSAGSGGSCMLRLGELPAGSVYICLPLES